MYTCIPYVSFPQRAWGCAHRSSLNALHFQSQQQTMSWGGKAPGLSPWRAPVAKELVIDLSSGRNERQRASREAPLPYPALQCPIGQSCESLSTLEPVCLSHNRKKKEKKMKQQPCMLESKVPHGSVLCSWRWNLLNKPWKQPSPCSNNSDEQYNIICYVIHYNYL